MTAKLKSLMQERNLDAQGVAVACGLRVTTVYRILNGTRGKRPSFELVSKIAQGLGVSTDFFSAETLHMEQSPAA